MSDEIKMAVDAVNKAFGEFKDTNDARLKAIEAKGTADPVIEAKLAKIEADMDTAQKAIDDSVLAFKRSQRMVTDQNGNTVDLDAKAQEWAAITSAAYNQRPFDMNAKAMDEYKAAHAAYVRKGMDGLSVDERKALSVGGDATGGFVVYPDMSGQIVTKVDETSPMRAYASVQVISTDALEGLFDLNRAGAVWVGELTAPGETSTPDLGKWRIPVHELAAMPKASQKILDDAAINMESWLAGKVAAEFALAENTAFVVGNGVDKPRGFLTYPAGTTLPGQIQQVPTGASGAFPTAPAGGDVLIDALYSLKAPYRANANWFMNRTTFAAVRKLKDSDGAYIWAPGLAVGQPATILGTGLASFEDMPNIGAGSLSIAVGDMRAAYQIVDRMGIRILRDPFTAKPNILFYTTKRVGGDVVNFEALKVIRFNT